MSGTRTQSQALKKQKPSSLLPNLQFTLPSSTQLKLFLNPNERAVQFSEAHELEPKSYKQLVLQIIQDVIDERNGKFAVTSSECEPKKTTSETETNIDKRLKYWQDVLAERRQLQHKIELETGKYPEQVLFNRRATKDAPDGQTMKRVLDYAERLRPESLSAKQLGMLHGYKEACTGQCIKELTETWPQAEREGIKNVEIVGIPNIVGKELLGKGAEYDVRNTWLQSSVLYKQLAKRFVDISKVVEFFPNTAQLAVSGQKVRAMPAMPIRLLRTESLHSVSSTTATCCSEEQLMTTELDAVTQAAELPKVGLSINGNVYVLGDATLTECVEMLIKFKCDPFKRELAHVLHITNIGQETLTFCWTQGVYYYKRASLLRSKDQDFLFDTNNFRLASGETYDLLVLYQPRKVQVTVELWKLEIEPKIFCCKEESLKLRFYGVCSAPTAYLDKINELQDIVLQQEKRYEIGNLPAQLASITPLLEPMEIYCPYDRTLDEREIFNAQNPGYNCSRFDDLEVLKGVHKQLKKPREPPWDLQLDTIKALIMRIEGSQAREAMFGNFRMIISTLQQKACSLEQDSSINDAERQRARFIYVRGVICTAIEDWENLMYTIETIYLNVEIKRFKNALKTQKEDQDDNNNNIIAKRDLDEATLQAIAFKKLQHSKYFRDAIYMQTYTYLCDVSEDIVSVIESTI